MQTGHWGIVRAALKQGRSPNYNDHGYTLLHWAVQEGHANIVRLLVEHGADPNAVEESGITPLYNATGSGSQEMVKLLVELGADVNYAPRYGTPLHNAAAHGYEDITAFLIADGAQVNTGDNEGQTPLFLAAIHGVRLLLANGAGKEVRDQEGKRAVDEARASADETLARKEAVVALLSGH